MTQGVIRCRRPPDCTWNVAYWDAPDPARGAGSPGLAVERLGLGVLALHVVDDRQIAHGNHKVRWTD